MTQQPSSLDRARRNGIAEAALAVFDEFGPPRGEERVVANEIFSRVLHSGTLANVADQFGLTVETTGPEESAGHSSAIWNQIGGDEIQTEVSFSVPGSPRAPTPAAPASVTTSAPGEDDGQGRFRDLCRSCGAVHPGHSGGRCPLITPGLRPTTLALDPNPPRTSRTTRAENPLTGPPSAGLSRRSSAFGPDLPPPALAAPTTSRVDAYGNRTEDTADYLLIRSKPGFARPGIYTGTWAQFCSLFPINPRTLKRLPQSGFHFRKPDSRAAARLFWNAQGHQGEPPHWGSFPHPQQQ